jgi:catechol 2,3-dioxygenase-like lactoylglutathione lyase family enzyme
MTRPALDGLFGVKLPVTDLARSLRWYQDVFGFEVYLEFPDDDGVVRGVGAHVAGLGDMAVALRENPEVARGIAGFDPVIWAVPDQSALEEWVAHLDALGIAHSPVIEASIGWLLVFHDPDGLEVHLYTRTRHGIDQRGRRGYGHPTGPDVEAEPGP